MLSVSGKVFYPIALLKMEKRFTYLFFNALMNETTGGKMNSGSQCRHKQNEKKKFQKTSFILLRVLLGPVRINNSVLKGPPLKIL